VTAPAYRDAAHGLLASDGVPVTVCRDSPGFIAQRIVSMIVNIGCSIAQSRTAAPADIDKAVTLGLNYPSGPFKFGDVLGADRVYKVLSAMYRIYGDPALPAQHLADAAREAGCIPADCRTITSYPRPIPIAKGEHHARRLYL
jgi:3-hydroxyacyl-CoA dehydrogenase